MSEVYIRGSDCKAALSGSLGWGSGTVSLGANSQLPLLNESIAFEKGTLNDETLQGEGGKFNHDVISEKYAGSLPCQMRCDGSILPLVYMVMGSGSKSNVASGVYDHTIELAPIHACTGSNFYHHQGTLGIGKGEFVDVYDSFKPTKMTITGNPANDIVATFDGVAYNKTKTSPGAANFSSWSEKTTKSFRFKNLTMYMSDWGSSKASWDTDDAVRISDFNLSVDRVVGADIQTNVTGTKFEEGVEGAREVGYTFTVPTVGANRSTDKRDFTDDVKNDTRKMIKLAFTGGVTEENANYNYALDCYMSSVYLTKGDKNIAGKDLVSITYECLLERTNTNITLMEQGDNKNELVFVWRNNEDVVPMRS